jgi:copper transport protein
MRITRRALALFGLAVAIVVATAVPAFAHATLLTTEPQPGGVFATSPPFVSLRFDQPVEVSLGGIRVFTADRERVVTGAPEHPGGAANQVRVSLPKLSNGTYVVTWRVISADSHPVEGAFTFGVGAKSSGQAKGSLEASLLSAQSGSKTVGVVYGVVRGVVFAALALLIGGVVFVSCLWPAGRRNRRARLMVWGGWIALVVSTVLAIVLEGLYASGLPMSKFFDTQVFSDVVGTRFGHVSLLRLALLALALPLLRMLFARDAPAKPLPKWWWVGAGAVGVALSFTPGLDGHASTGRWVPLAVPADAVHVAAMCCWLGGLALLCFAVLPRRNVEELEEVLPRYSALALGAIIALILTGAFQAYRQVGSIEALKSTTYGQLLIAKLVAFAALIVAAAFSREVVNRRFRTYTDEQDDADLVPAGVSSVVPGPAFPSGGGGVGTIVRDDIDDDGDDFDDESEIRRLRRSVFVEVVIAVVILSITVLLVNAAPARTVATAPVSLTLKSPKLWVDVTIAPGIAGGNDVHVTALPLGGGFTNVENMQVQLVKSGAKLPPFNVPIQLLGPGHGYAPLFDIPYPGKWQIVVRAQTSATDESVLTGTFTLR